jgi:hypothetical protein
MLNFFALDESWVTRQHEKMGRVLTSLESTARGGPCEPNLEPSRYRDGLSRLGASKTLGLRTFLREYAAALRVGTPASRGGPTPG